MTSPAKCDCFLFKEGADKRREEQRKYGVFYDDDYDYLQHLKDVDELRDVAPGEAVWLEIPREDADVDKKVVFIACYFLCRCYSYKDILCF